MEIPKRCLELYSGIGGFAVAAEQLGWRVIRSIDINQLAAEVHRANFQHELLVRTIESLPAEHYGGRRSGFLVDVATMSAFYGKRKINAVP